jgi:hypothetical protein
MFAFTREEIVANEQVSRPGTCVARASPHLIKPSEREGMQHFLFAWFAKEGAENLSHMLTSSSRKFP